MLRILFHRLKTKETLINVGSSSEMTIAEYAKLIIKKLNSKLKIKFDKSKHDGTKRKILNCSIAKKYGWKSKISLDSGFNITYKNFLKNYKK